MIQKIRSYWKFILLGLGLLLIAFIFVVPRVKAFVAGPQAKYKTEEVKREDLVRSVSVSGEIQAEKQVVLKFQTSGLLTWVGVKKGDQVKKWQAIASLDKKEIEKTLKKKLLAYMNERWDFEQSREDYGVEGIPIEQKGTLTEAERRILEKTQFDLDSTVLDVEIQDLARQYATLVSPIAGIVTNLDVPVAGVNITPATATFTIADPSEMKFIANIDESDIGQITIGQAAIIALDAYSEEEFKGTVKTISFSSLTTKGGGTAFPSDISLPNNQLEKFKVGMNGDAEIILARAEEVLTVPLEAVFEKNSQSYVKIIDGRNVKEIPVETGLESETKMEIRSGLNEGQLVIYGEKK
jgi:RND family efflux transporter MFP subunit